MEGKDAGNYILPEGGISGTITNGVIRGNTNNAGGNNAIDGNEDIVYKGGRE